MPPPVNTPANAVARKSRATAIDGGQLGLRGVAPPIYNPQPTPRVLQTKMAAGNLREAQARISLKGPQPRTQPKVLPPRIKAAQPKLEVLNRIAGPPPARVVAPRRVVQRIRSRVVQATRFYPNLHPGAVEPVDPSNIFRLNSFADQYRLHKVHSHGVNVPNQQYNFVRTGEGEMLLHSRYRHPSIAEGKQVLYAGEIYFNNGKLEWWSNGSGHYQPDTDNAEQANLPMDQFFSYQQILKGEHTRKRQAG